MRTSFFLSLVCLSLIVSYLSSSEKIFYTDYKSGAHPILDSKIEIETVFKSIDTYLKEDNIRNLDKGVTRFFIVRHAESEANKLGINAGRLDFPLSEKGRQDAEELGERLAKQMWDLKIEAVYHTSLVRTSETYEYMNRGWEKLRSKGLPIPQIADGLLEKNNGMLEGMRKEEYDPIKRKEAQAIESIVEFDDLFDYKIPEGGDQFESLHEVWNRAISNLNEIAQKHPGKNMLIISHVGTMRSLIVGGAAAKDQPVLLNYRKFDIKNGSVLAIISNGNGIQIEAVSPFDYEKSKN